MLISTGHTIEFQIGQEVYLKTNNEQHARMITGINLKPNKGVIYCLSHGQNETLHYGLEIDNERNIITMTT